MTSKLLLLLNIQHNNMFYSSAYFPLCSTSLRLMKEIHHVGACLDCHILASATGKQKQTYYDSRGLLEIKISALFL